MSYPRSPAVIPYVCIAVVFTVSGLSRVFANDIEREQLAAALRQVQAMERRAEVSAASTVVEPGQRYYFDYPRLLADLARVKAGLQDYLTPSRAQPRDPRERAGQYRLEFAAGEQRAETQTGPRKGERP